MICSLVGGYFSTAWPEFFVLPFSWSLPNVTALSPSFFPPSRYEVLLVVGWPSCLHWATTLASVVAAHCSFDGLPFLLTPSSPSLYSTALFSRLLVMLLFDLTIARSEVGGEAASSTTLLRDELRWMVAIAGSDNATSSASIRYFILNLLRKCPVYLRVTRAALYLIGLRPATPLSRFVTSSVSWGNSHSSKPLPKAAAAKGVPKSKMRPKPVNVARAKNAPERAAGMIFSVPISSAGKMSVSVAASPWFDDP